MMDVGTMMRLNDFRRKLQKKRDRANKSIANGKGSDKLKGKVSVLDEVIKELTDIVRGG